MEANEAERELPADAEESNSVSVRVIETSTAVVANKFSSLLRDPRRWFHRYLVLFFVCMLTVGFYYSYNSLIALQRTIIHVMQIDSTKFSILNSVYSWPNIVIPIICGFLLDRVYGIRIGTVIFNFILCIGQLIVALGGMFNKFPVVFVGRVVYGLIGDSLGVAQIVYAIMWSKPTELSRVFGLLVSFSRIASALTLNTDQRMFDALNGTKPERLGTVFFIGFAFCILSLLCAIALGLFDKRAERILERKKKEKINLKDIKEFPRIYWLVVAICVTFYVNIIPFVGIATKFLIDKYGLTYSEANVVSSLVYIIPAGTSPFIGYIVDKSGFNLVWLNGGIIISLVGHAIFSLLPSATFIPYLAMALMGTAYSVVGCVLWPLVVFMIPDYQLGTAYGIMQAVQNLGLSVVILIIGVILENHGYLILEIVFEGLLCLSLFFGICLYVLDSNSGGQLNMSGCDRAGLHSGNDDRRQAAPMSSELASDYPTINDD